jgi:alpha-galactosidase
MLLSGDDITQLSAARISILGKLSQPDGKAAQFTDETMTVGIIRRRGYKLICLFNWDDQSRSLTVPLSEPCRLRDLWTDQDLGLHANELTLHNLPGHSARLLVCMPPAK